MTKLTGNLPKGRIRSVNVQKVLDLLPTDQCVDWPGQRDRQGYGAIDSEISHLAHRYVYLLLNEKPDLPELDHTCRRRSCVNPAHLDPVTTAENARRRVEATRHGHPYGDDVYVFRGRRYCRECRRAADRRRPSGGARAKRTGVAA
jgi:hypothetical protein